MGHRRMVDIILMNMRRGVILLRRAARVRTGARVSARLAIGLTVILLG